MRILITGAYGFLGTKLVQALLKRGTLCGPNNIQSPVSSLLLTDVSAIPPSFPVDPRIEHAQGDIADLAFTKALFKTPPTSVFHLAALVSGGAEKDFVSGYRANLFGTWNLLEACRESQVSPRFVFASSIAAYGGDLPDIISDSHHLVPESSYGAHKVIGELLTNDYTRKGFVDGRSLRLPVIAVRSGLANTAASSWASGLVREPLNGRDYDCPVAKDDRGFLLSPRKAIAGLITGHESAAELWGRDRSVMMAGLNCSAGEIVAGLARVAGHGPERRVRWRPDPFVRRIITSWPVSFSLVKAHRIGLSADASVDEIIQNYVEEEL